MKTASVRRPRCKDVAAVADRSAFPYYSVNFEKYWDRVFESISNRNTVQGLHKSRCYV